MRKFISIIENAFTANMATDYVTQSNRGLSLLMHWPSVTDWLLAKEVKPGLLKMNQKRIAAARQKAFMPDPQEIIQKMGQPLELAHDIVWQGEAAGRFFFIKLDLFGDQTLRIEVPAEIENEQALAMAEHIYSLFGE